MSAPVHPVHHPPPGGEAAAPPGNYWLRLLALAAGISAAVYGYQPLLGQGLAFRFPIRYFLYGAGFLTAATLLGERRRGGVMAVVALICLHHVWLTCPALAWWVAVLIPALYRLLGPDDRPGPAASGRFWAGLLFGVVVLPKALQLTVLHNAHDTWLDRNQNLLAGLFLRYAYYYYERRRGIVPAGRFWEHVSYLLFVPQVTGMLNLPFSEQRDRWGFGWPALRRGFGSVAWAAVKIPPILWLEKSVLPGWGYGRGYAALHTAPRWELWAGLGASYLYWAILVSAKFDLMAALFRFFGVNVDDNFRWPLLATSPVGLWRRWNVYNRKLLLKFVYFPLGGSHKRVYFNIMATFLASALLLHTGYFGSPWLYVDPGQGRDWLLYFAGQGALVCGAYWWINRPFWTRLPAVPRVALAGAGWAFTLASSAWLHVLPLAAGHFLNAPSPPIADLGQRLALMARALGWP